MDTDTAEGLQALIRMIDNVNERNSLSHLTLNAVMVLLASARRQGALNKIETAMIETTFDDVAEGLKDVPYEGVQRLFEQARALWDAAKPR